MHDSKCRIHCTRARSTGPSRVLEVQLDRRFDLPPSHGGSQAKLPQPFARQNPAVDAPSVAAAHPAELKLKIIPFITIEH